MHGSLQSSHGQIAGRGELRGLDGDLEASLRWRSGTAVICVCIALDSALKPPVPNTAAMMSGEVTDLSPSIAFRVFPIAHAYNMWGVLKRCTKAALECFEEGDKTAPDLFQWLAASDARHYTPIITACLERLKEQQSAAAAGGSGDHKSSGGSGSKATPATLDEAYASRSAIRSTLCDKEHRQLLEGLKPETTLDLVGVMAGLPLGYKVFCGRLLNLVVISS